MLKKNMDTKDKLLETFSEESNKIRDEFSKELKPVKYPMLRILITPHETDWVKEQFLKRKESNYYVD